MISSRRILIFGATGAIGAALADSFAKDGCDVLAITRKTLDNAVGKKCANIKHLSWDVLAGGPDLGEWINLAPIDSVIWSQGANCNDDIFDFDLHRHEKMYAVNVSYILISLQFLLRNNLLTPRARLCVISSIWQNLARQKKLSYCVTKSALQGLVQSLAIDLGAQGIMVNAVLPGALDTPMTRSNLSNDQILSLEKASPLASLPGLEDVFGLTAFLCSEKNTGITGQFIAADRGFSRARII